MSIQNGIFPRIEDDIYVGYSREIPIKDMDKWHLLNSIKKAGEYKIYRPQENWDQLDVVIRVLSEEVARRIDEK